MAGRNELHKKYINVFVEIDVILGLYDLKSHIKYTHNTHSQTLANSLLPFIIFNTIITGHFI